MSGSRRSNLVIGDLPTKRAKTIQLQQPMRCPTDHLPLEQVLLRHDPNLLAEAVEHAALVDADDLVPVLGGVVGRAVSYSCDARAIDLRYQLNVASYIYTVVPGKASRLATDRVVEAAKLLLGALDHVEHRGRVSDIADDGVDIDLVGFHTLP